MRPVNVTVGKQQNAFTLHHTVTPLSRIRGAILEGDIPFTDKSIKRRFVNTFVAENDTWANRDLKNNYKKNYEAIVNEETEKVIDERVWRVRDEKEIYININAIK